METEQTSARKTLFPTEVRKIDAILCIVFLSRQHFNHCLGLQKVWCITTASCDEMYTNLYHVQDADNGFSQ
jgi:hypothetical protein